MRSGFNLDKPEDVALDVKLQFLYEVYQPWEDRTAFQDEPIYTYIKAQDMTRALVTLCYDGYLDLEEGGDMEYYINRAYERIFTAIEEAGGNMDLYVERASDRVAEWQADVAAKRGSE